MTKLFIRTAFTAMVCGSLAAPAFAQQVSVTLKDGLVTIKAENATVRQILDEWARVGQAKVINADKLVGTPMTLTLVNVPERQALDTILRGTSGYLAIDRTTPVANASAYERVMVMNKTTQAVASAAPAGAAAPTYTPPPMVTDNFQPGVDTDNPQGIPSAEPPPPNAPVANPYAQGGGAGVGMATGGAGSAYGGVNGTANGGAGNGNTATTNPADVKFDYANPVPYFEAQRQLQQQQQQTPQQTQPTATPGGNQLLTQPGVAPMPQQNTAPPATNTNPYNPPANFNPYNLKPGETIPGTTPQPQNVTPDRSKYANPYQPQP